MPVAPRPSSDTADHITPIPTDRASHRGDGAERARPIVVSPTVPFVPRDILVRNAVYVSTDNRLTSAYRLLAALWRSDLPAGTYTPAPRRGRAAGSETASARPVRLGSRLSPAAARAGLNFLTPEIAAHAREVLLRRDYGVLLMEDRILANMLSSTAALINLLGPLALDLDLATAVFRCLLPAGFVGRVTGIRYETAGNLDGVEPLDRTAFDALIDIVSPEGEVSFCAIEFKLTEGAGGTVPPPRPGYAEATRMSGLYRDPDAVALTRPGVEQLRREGVLAQGLLRRGLYGRGYFVLLGPAQNRYCRTIGQRYAAELVEPGEGAGRTGFLSLTIEAVVDAIAAAGAGDHAAAVQDRYLDLERVARYVLDQPLPALARTSGGSRSGKRRSRFGDTVPEAGSPRKAARSGPASCAVPGAPAPSRARTGRTAAGWSATDGGARPGA